MDLEIDGRTAIVTGSARGFGKAIAESLLEEGANVTLCDIDADALQAAADELSDRDGNVFAVQTDLTDDDDVERLVDDTLDEFGSIDVLVNNAGIIGSEKQFHELPLDEWKQVYDVNIYGVIRTTKQVLPHMREQGWGRIINIASEAGTQPDDHKPHYDSSKAAIINFTKNLSKAYSKDGVLVNAVSPATSWTPLVEDLFENRATEQNKTIEQIHDEYIENQKPGMVFGLERLGEPHEVASVVTFLASEQASYVTGANYRVDGGSIFTMDS